MRRRTKLLICAVIVIVVVLAAIAVFLPAPKKKVIRWAGGESGSAGEVITGLIMNLYREKLPEYEFIVTPLSTIASAKEFAKGTIDVPYLGTYSTPLFWRREGPFKDLPPGRKALPLMGIYPIRYFLAVLNDSPYHTLKDLFDKPAYYGFGTPREVFETIFEACGYKDRMKHFEIDKTLVPSYLGEGRIAAALWYTTSTTVVPYFMDALVRYDVRVLGYTDEEIEKIKKELGPFFTEMDLDWLNSVAGQDVKPTKGKLYQAWYISGYLADPEVVTEEDGYKMIKVIMEHAKELAAASKIFEDLARDPARFQYEYAKQLAGEIPLHPGLAKYLKENGYWEPGWKTLS
jgi:TRAP-type uncharacterized transport system substrate-binding protein